MEEFFKDYQYTFSALGAIGTFATVIVALVLAYKKPKPSIEAPLQIKQHGDYFFKHGHKSVDFYFVVVSILNTSQNIIEIQENSFRMNKDIVYPLDFIPTDYSEGSYPGEGIFHEFYGKKNEIQYYYPLKDKIKKYPVRIEPRLSEDFYIYLIDYAYTPHNYLNFRVVLNEKHCFKLRNYRKFNQELKALPKSLKDEMELRKAKKTL